MFRILAATLLALFSTACFGAPGYTVSSGSLFSFTPVSALTLLTLGDNELSAPQSPAGFSFIYFGATYTSFGVGSNGYIILGSQGTTVANQPSHGTAPGQVISPFWGDMRPNLQGQIGWNFSVGKLTVEWLGVRLATSTAQGGPYNVQIQIVLDTATGQIEFLYGDYGGFGIGPGSPWDYTCAISGPSGGAQAIVPGDDGSFISSTGRITLWPLLRYTRFVPVVVPNSAPALTVTRNGGAVNDGATLVASLGATLVDQDFVISVNDSDGDNVSVSATITNIGVTGILESEFSSASAPAPFALSPQSGTFSAPHATHLFTLSALDGKGGAAALSFTVVVSAAAGGPALGAGPGGGCTAGDEGEALPVIVVIVRSVWHWAKRHPLQAGALALLAALAICLPVAVAKRSRRAIQM